MHKSAVIFALLALCALQTSAKPIQNETVEALTEPITEPTTEPTTEESVVDEESTDASAEDGVVAPAEEPVEEFVEVSPQWVGDEVYVAVPEHERYVRHIGFGGIGGGFVGGFSGGEIISPAYSVSSIQTVPVITSVPVVSTISTYPTYSTGYGYGGFSPIGFGGVGFGKFRSSYSVKGFGVGGGFIG
uniref:Probable ubiquitin-conjugating enzyme E2 R521 n=1 Tax=Zeugodacus cucurbitae TaxID=28588 RepID=A0A0A1X694_ZEUCU